MSGATSYFVYRSSDAINYSAISGALTLPSYLDTTAVIGTLYYYQMTASNSSGESPATNSIPTVPTSVGEMSLLELRYKTRERADRVNSQFVTNAELDGYIMQSMYELYDLLVTSYQDYFLAPALTFPVVSNQNLYPLPDGTNLSGAPAFYKMRGLDLYLNAGQRTCVTLTKFNFNERNKYLYPNSNSAIYGFDNLQYRLMGNSIELIPTPATGQQLQLWYVPRLKALLQDTDMTTIGYSGWLEYVIVRAAILMLTKEESDTSQLMTQIIAIGKRIEDASQNRDEGRPDTITNVRAQSGWSAGNNGFQSGGW